LNHLNIAHIYGIEESNGTRALVMELVEGETLADRIARGPIPLDEALPIAKQIAEALEAAHEQGIIHRDLKPANIKLRPDGTVKVLDFGLAKLAESSPATAGGPTPLSLSPTITSPAIAGTMVGTLLGTAAYMSPEQARSKAVDKRADIWAFGCVLYEMLTGSRAFGGEELTDTLAFIITREPDWAALPPETPVAVKRLLRRCLEKDRRRRLADAADARLEIEDGLAAAAGRDASSWEPGTTADERQTISDIAVADARRELMRSARRRMATIGAAGLVLAGVTGVVVWLASRAPAPLVTRLTIAAPAGSAPSVTGVDRDVAITPDGSRVVYAGANGTQLFVRALDALEPSSVFQGAPRAPFISPDGQWIGFADAIYSLKKVFITGGPVVTITRADGGSRGATWLADDTIIFGNADPSVGLQRVSSAGGVPVVLTRPDRGKGEIDHLWPEALPGNRGVLFTITRRATWRRPRSRCWIFRLAVQKYSCVVELTRITSAAAIWCTPRARPSEQWGSTSTNLKHAGRPYLSFPSWRRRGLEPWTRQSRPTEHWHT
jgi:serine/threonine-protein kinase